MKTDLQLLDVTNITDNSPSSDLDLISSLVIGKNLVYNEMSDFPVRRRTELETLTENMMTLSDLNDRLAFMSEEIKYLMNLK